MRSRTQLRWIWSGSLVLFVLAAATGVLYRVGVAYGFTFGLSLLNVRHAHSHLMYFGWVTPALMVLLWQRGLKGQENDRTRAAFERLIVGVFVAAAVAYPLFLLYGYSPTVIGSARMPLSVIASTLNMILWYGFVALYVRVRRDPQADRTAQGFIDAAVAFLVAATLGAWGLGLLQPLGVHSAVWSSALTHIFLDLFSEGWLVLGVLGLAYHHIGPAPSAASRWSLRLVCAGVPLTFALGMPSSLVPPGAAVLARCGGVLVGLGLLLSATVLLRQVRTNSAPGWVWAVPLSLLVAKALGQLIVSVAPGAWWGSMQGFRVLYLHIMLLGFVSLGLAAAAASTWGRAAVAGAGWFYLTVVVLLCSLLPLTSLWPAAWRSIAAVKLAAWIAPLPVMAALLVLVRGVRHRGSGL